MINISDVRWLPPRSKNAGAFLNGVDTDIILTQLCKIVHRENSIAAEWFTYKPKNMGFTMKKSKEVILAGRYCGWILLCSLQEKWT